MPGLLRSLLLILSVLILPAQAADKNVYYLDLTDEQSMAPFFAAVTGQLQRGATLFDASYWGCECDTATAADLPVEFTFTSTIELKAMLRTLPEGRFSWYIRARDGARTLTHWEIHVVQPTMVLREPGREPMALQLSAVDQPLTPQRAG